MSGQEPDECETTCTRRRWGFCRIRRRREFGGKGREVDGVDRTVGEESFSEILNCGL